MPYVSRVSSPPRLPGVTAGGRAGACLKERGPGPVQPQGLQGLPAGRGRGRGQACPVSPLPCCSQTLADPQGLERGLFQLTQDSLGSSREPWKGAPAALCSPASSPTPDCRGPAQRVASPFPLPARGPVPHPPRHAPSLWDAVGPPTSQAGPAPNASLHLKRGNLRPREGRCGGAPGHSLAQAPRAVPCSLMGTVSPSAALWGCLAAARAPAPLVSTASGHSPLTRGPGKGPLTGKEGEGRVTGAPRPGAHGAEDSVGGSVGQPLLPGVLRRGAAARGAVGPREGGGDWAAPGVVERGTLWGAGRAQPWRGWAAGRGDPSIKLEDGPSGVRSQSPRLPLPCGGGWASPGLLSPCPGRLGHPEP